MQQAGRTREAAHRGPKWQNKCLLAPLSIIPTHQGWWLMSTTAHSHLLPKVPKRSNQTPSHLPSMTRNKKEARSSGQLQQKSRQQSIEESLSAGWWTDPMQDMCSCFMLVQCSQTLQEHWIDPIYREGFYGEWQEFYTGLWNNDLIVWEEMQSSILSCKEDRAKAGKLPMNNLENSILHKSMPI